MVTLIMIVIFDDTKLTSIFPSLSGPGASVTRFGEILPLWWIVQVYINFKGIIWSLHWQICNDTVQICTVVNGQTLNWYCANLYGCKWPNIEHIIYPSGHIPQCIQNAKTEWSCFKIRFLCQFESCERSVQIIFGRADLSNFQFTCLRKKTFNDYSFLWK